MSGWAVAIAVLAAGLVPRGAQVPEASMTLAAVPAWVAIGSDFALDLDLQGDLSGADVVLTVRERLQSRTAFDRTLEPDANLGATVGSVAAPVATLSPGSAGTHRLRVHIGPAPPPPEDAPESAVDIGPAIDVGQEGVYPIVVELQPGPDGEPLSSLVTYLVALNAGAERAPLGVAWVWPMAVGAAREPDGTVPSRLRDAVAPAGRIGQMTAALATAPDVPVTVAPRGATLDAWGEAAGEPDAPSASTLSALQGQASLATRQVLAGTYAGVDLPALAAARLGEEITAQLAEGADVLRQTLRLRADPRTYLVAGAIDARSLAALRPAGVDRLVLPRDSLVSIFEPLTPANPFHVVSGPRSFLAAATDPVISELLDPGSASDAQSAQRFLSALALVALESPSTARGVVVAPPETWAPTTSLLTAALRGLDGHPALAPMTLDTFFGDVPVAQGDTEERALGPVEASSLALSRGQIDDARQRIASLVTMLPESAPEPVIAGRRLLLAEAEPLQRRDADPSASDYLGGVERTITAVLGAVRLPETPSVTLTARRGRVPITFVNDSGRPLTITVHFRSDNLLFPDGNKHSLVLPPRSTTTRFTVEARTSGAFPMIVEVTSPDGRLTVGSFEMRVRSTAVSGVALAITVGAGLFLVGWWGNHVRTARERRREQE